MVSIKGLSKASVLAALCNATSPRGLGFFHGNGDVTEEQAAAVLGRTTYVDYCAGRPIKADFSSDEIDPRLYDRDAGAGAMQRVVDGLRSKVTA